LTTTGGGLSRISLTASSVGASSASSVTVFAGALVDAAAAPAFAGALVVAAAVAGPRLPVDCAAAGGGFVGIGAGAARLHQARHAIPARMAGRPNRGFACAGRGEE
jgi:hypothetical protein